MGAVLRRAKALLVAACMALAMVPTFVAPVSAHQGSDAVFPAGGHMNAWYTAFLNVGATEEQALCSRAFWAMYEYTQQTYGQDWADLVISPYTQHGYDIKCPGSGAHPDGPAHGVTCNGTGLGPEGQCPYVSVRGPAGVGKTVMDGADGHDKLWATYYGFVHETMHAVAHVTGNNGADECLADDLAVAFGAHDHFGRCV